MPLSYPPGRSGGRRPAPGLFFTAVNGSLLAAQLLAAITAQSFMGSRVFGDVTTGFLLLAVQVVVLLLTAVRYELGAGAGADVAEGRAE